MTGQHRQCPPRRRLNPRELCVPRTPVKPTGQGVTVLEVPDRGRYWRSRVNDIPQILEPDSNAALMPGVAAIS